MYNYEELPNDKFIDMTCLINNIMCDIEKNKISNFGELVDFYLTKIINIDSQENTTEEEDMEMINLKVIFEFIFHNSNFFGNLFNK